MLKLIQTGTIIFLACMSWSCGLERAIELDLPPYTPQPAIEGYLTPGQPFAVLITRTAGFFEPLELNDQQFVENLLYDSARVLIRYGNQEVELRNQLFFNPFTAQLYNYASSMLVPENYVDSFYLEVEFPDGTMATGATKILPLVPIDSSVIEYPEVLDGDTLARIFSYITDPDPIAVNRFRRILTYNPVDSGALQDFVFTDELSDQAVIPVGTTYYFSPGDTVYAYNAHVDEPYDKYLLSTQLAEQSNGNPFAQPSSLLSNLRGSSNPVGIFTTYAYVVDTIIVPAP